MSNKLIKIVKDSGLEKTKAQYILDKFTDYFKIAADWEKKAKNIVVKDEKDTTEMQMARVGRLFLREKRIAIEKSRVELKEQALREGKAIDGISNILKALIIPIETYLETQEKFVEIKRAEEVEGKRIEAEKKEEKKILAEEKAEKAKQRKIRLENIELKKEAEEKDKKIRAERKVAEARIKRQEEITAKIEKKAEEQKLEAEKVAKIKQEKADKKLADEKLEKDKIQKLLDEKIECPFCHRKFSKK